MSCLACISLSPRHVEIINTLDILDLYAKLNCKLKIFTLGRLVGFTIHLIGDIIVVFIDKCYLRVNLEK